MDLRDHKNLCEMIPGELRKSLLTKCGIKMALLVCAYTPSNNWRIKQTADTTEVNYHQMHRQSLSHGEFLRNYMETRDRREPAAVAMVI